MGEESRTLKELTREILEQESRLKEGGGPKGQARQKKLGRLPVRERLGLLLDDPSEFFEIGIWAAYELYPQVGNVPAAGVVTGIGKVLDRSCMIVANDATVKAGAFFPQTVKKVLRAQRIAFECNLPLIYLVDSAGVYLPMQDEIFPDEDDFGRIFRNNAVLSAAGIPQYAAIMGNCVAGGAYLPVLCDRILMTEGSGLFLAGPALVKAAIGQVVDTEELGGASMHAEVSGTVDFKETDDPACISRLRELVGLLPKCSVTESVDSASPAESPETIYELVNTTETSQYDVRDLLLRIVDSESFNEYKGDYGTALVTGFARLSGIPVGIVANQKRRTRSIAEGIQIGGVIYTDSADKAARFVMDCNQSRLPILFLQDVVGFMVGPRAEKSGIIRSGAKLVNAVSNSTVPKITVITGGSFGAGNYALCGKAYDPRFILAWPNAKYAVMGADQASQVTLDIKRKSDEKHGQTYDSEELEGLYNEIRKDYQRQMDIRYAAARGWIDGIIAPHSTRCVLSQILRWISRKPPASRFHTGVIQV